MHVVRTGFAGGGMENGIVNVTNRLSPERFRVSICVLDSTESFSERLDRSKVEIHLIPKTLPGIDWTLVWKLARLFKRTNTDLVHSHNWGTFLYAVLAAKWARVPIIHGDHGRNVSDLARESWLKRWVKAFLGKRVERLSTVSQTLASEWEAYGIPASKIRWIPNGVDVSRFHPRDVKPAFRRKFGLPENGLLIGSIGRLDTLKNYEVLVAAFARLATSHGDSNLALLGRGPEEQRLKAMADELKVADRVFFLGHRPNPEDFLAGLDVFVLPSKFEGMSNVVLEAMASGLPVVCADLPCHHEVFEADKEGLVVSPCNADVLAREMERLFRDHELRNRLASAARKKALERFSIERMVSEYERLYRDAVGSRLIGGIPANTGSPAT